jgi:ribosomal protein S12 methylthiotransferase
VHVKKNASNQRPLRVGLISLGCAKNLVDAEIMLGSLMRNGVEIINDAAAADAIIVNTCSFIDAAQEESVDTILESAEVREAANRGQALIVSGCLPQRFRDELPKLLPEVDAFMGIDQVAQVNQIVQQALVQRQTKLNTPAPRAQRDRDRSPRPKEGKSQIVQTLSNLDTIPTVSKEESLRGTDQFGKTKTVAGPKNRIAAEPASDSGPLVDVHVRPSYIPDFVTPRFRLTPRHLAYVKIAEGCNHPCSFCTIPRMRGAHRSRSQADIVREAKQLIAEGVKELNLISQDSTYYGLDLRPDRRGSIAAPDRFRAAADSLPADAATLCTLLRELNALKGDFWVRLLYTHPAHWTDELIRTIAECPKVARYVDMPLQHIHAVMLERMRRETSQEFIVDLIARIRAGIPGIALRTTFIVGFPGETEAYFETLLEFIRATRFERLGVFTYSQEETTRAGKMLGQLSEKAKRTRRERAMALQLQISKEISQSFVGRQLKVLVEKEAQAKELATVSSWEHGLIRDQSAGPNLPGKYLVARGEADAPDIDGRVYVRGKLPLSEFATVKVIGHADYDLIGETVS